MDHNIHWNNSWAFQNKDSGSFYIAFLNYLKLAYFWAS